MKYFTPKSLSLLRWLHCEEYMCVCECVREKDFVNTLSVFKTIPSFREEILYIVDQEVRPQQMSSFFYLIP